MDAAWEVMAAERLRRGRRLRKGEWPVPAPRYVSERPGRQADIRLMFGRDVFIVSERFREVLERAAPGAAEFLRVRIAGSARGGRAERYWAINWLRVFKCQPDPDIAEIDASLVPSNGAAGVVAGTGWWCGGEVIVRRDVKREMERAGLVGVRFAPVRVRGKPLDLVWRWNAAKRKRERVERRLVPSERCFDVEAFLASGRGPNDRTKVPGCTAFLEYAMMHSAMGTLKDRVVIRMLEAGGNPNVGATANLSPLVVVIAPRSLGVLRALNQADADWKAANVVGITALMSAAMDGDVRAVRALLGFGADPLQQDRSGMTAADHARESMEGADRAETKRLRGVVNELSRR